MSTSSPRRALPALAVGMGLIVLDGTIVAVALPTIIADLGLGVAQAEWVSSLYSVIFAALLLPLGRAGDLWGRKRLFISGLVLFGVGSAACALAGSALSLIAGRAIQGIGAAGVLPSSLATTNALFTGKARAGAFGVWGATMASAAALGPLVGGVVASVWSWPGVFAVTVPAAFAVALWAALVLPADRPVSGGRLDWVGGALSAAGAGGLVFGLIEGPSLGWWRPASREAASIAGASPVPFALALGALGLAAFVSWEFYVARAGRLALLDLTLFSLRSFSLGNATAFIVAAGEFVLVFALPLYLTGARGMDALACGGILAAMAFGALISGASARHVAARIGALGTVVAGLALEVVGVCGLAWAIHVDASVFAIVGLLIVYGVGLGFASAQLTSTVLAEVDESRSGQGSATQSTVRQFGTALGVGGAGTLLATVLAAKVGAVPLLDGGASQAVVESAGAALPAILEALREHGMAAQAELVRAAYVDTMSLVVAAAGAALVVAWVFSIVLRAGGTPCASTAHDSH
ncbi:MAG: MFS transporter [Actinomycetaceae bacterium]|nr:MFS transporter [Actinomycetaceae bacterium]